MMVLLDQLLAKGFDGANLIMGLSAHTRNVMMAKDPKTLPLLEVSEDQRHKFEEQAKQAPTPFLYKALKIMNDCDINYRQSSNKRLLVELTLIRIGQITQPADEDVPGAGRSPYRLKSLFKKLASILPKPAIQVAGVERLKAETSAQPTDATPNVTTNSNAKTEPQTATAPTQKATPTNVSPKGKVGLFGSSFASVLNKPQDVQEENGNEKETVAEATANKHEFTQDELQVAWVRMCNRMPQNYVGLAARMRNMSVVITQHPCIEIVVDNSTLLSQVQEIRNRIRLTLAKDLDNEHIQVEIRQAKPEEVVKVLSKKEVYEEMLQKSPAIEKLRATLDLTMM